MHVRVCHVCISVYYGHGHFEQDSEFIHLENAGKVNSVIGSMSKIVERVDNFAQGIREHGNYFFVFLRKLAFLSHDFQYWMFFLLNTCSENRVQDK